MVANRHNFYVRSNIKSCIIIHTMEICEFDYYSYHMDIIDNIFYEEDDIVNESFDTCHSLKCEESFYTCEICNEVYIGDVSDKYDHISKHSF